MDANASSDIEAASWLFENAVDVLLVLDGEGRIQSTSPSWRTLTGWSDAQTLGRECLDFIHGDDSELIQAHVVLMDLQGAASCEHRLLAASGEWLWVRSRVKRAADGRAMSVLQDISAERRRAKEQARMSRVAELLGVNAGVYVWRYDSIDHAYDLNPLLEGRERGDPNLRTPAGEFQAAIHPDDWSRMEASWRRSLETGEMGQVEYRYHFEGAGWRRMRSAWHGVSRQPGGLWEILGISQDITELADARDAALEAAEVKSRFLANMGHEISTPMNGVLGVLHLLKGEGLSERNQALVEDALGCGAALAQSLHDIVEFTSLEAGDLDLAPEPVELAHALDAVVGTLRPAAEARGLQLEARASGGRRLGPARSAAPAPDPVEPGRQRREIHPEGRGGGDSGRPGNGRRPTGPDRGARHGRGRAGRGPGPAVRALPAGRWI
jgi:PAS domain S-box-containing protein